MFFFFCIPGHARFSVRWVKHSPQSAAVSQPVPKASCGHPSDWAMSGVSKRPRTAGCGWGFEDLCRMDIRLNGKFSVWLCGGGRAVDSVQFLVCGGGRGVDNIQFSVWRLWLELLCPAGGCCPLLSQCLGAATTLFWLYVPCDGMCARTSWTLLSTLFPRNWGRHPYTGVTLTQKNCVFYAKKEQATQIWKCHAFTVRKKQWPHTSKCV